jgi:hypothetical protein
MGRRMAGLVVIAGAAVAGLVLARRRSMCWGATEQECGEILPGDNLIADMDLTATRAVTVLASADVVWPWVAQLGQGKGGLYSYDALENLVGCDMHSADHVVAEWQDVRVGDPFRLHPDVSLEVRQVDPGRSLVVGGGVTMGETPPPYDFTWAFVLREQADGSTRLLVRERYGYSAWWAPVLVEPVEGVSFLMTQKMLRGIRDRAERDMVTREMNRR